MTDEVVGNVDQLATEIRELRDLFARRLYEDRQKAALIETITQQSRSALDLAENRALEPLIKEILLALDRLAELPDPTGHTSSVADEILEVFARRGLERIPALTQFDPQIHEIVSREPLPDDFEGPSQMRVQREGYVFGERVLRPVQVVLLDSAMAAT